MRKKSSNYPQSHRIEEIHSKDSFRFEKLMSTDKRRDTTEPRKKSTIVKHWERDLRRGLLQLMILMLIRLRTEKAHGYGLIKLIKKTDIGIDLKAGTIYPLLKRMESDGLIESFHADDSTQPGVPRRIYLITKEGEKMIEEMMNTYDSYNNTIMNWYNEIKNSRR